MESEKQKNRSGRTIVTSVSVSKEFQKLIDQYNISPTECFRKGVAVTLFDLGVAMYQSEKNEERSKYMHEFLKKIKETEDNRQITEDVANIKELIKENNRIKERISSIALCWVGKQEDQE